MLSDQYMHFGLTPAGETANNMIFSGPLNSCKRFVMNACKCKIVNEQEDSLESKNTTKRISEYKLHDQSGEHAGLINRNRYGWTLVLSKKVWETQS
jgi:hypothetical protein